MGILVLRPLKRGGVLLMDLHSLEFKMTKAVMRGASFARQVFLSAKRSVDAGLPIGLGTSYPKP